VKTPVRLGLVGFGRLARSYYVPALRELTEARIAGVVDPLTTSLEAARATYPGIVTSAHLDSLLEQGIDAFIVASPPSTHVALWLRAAANGIPVFLEKPAGLRDELATAAPTPRQRSLLMVNFTRRFWPPYQRMRELVRRGVLGQLTGLDIRLHVNVKPWCSVTSHRLQPGEGGVLFDLGSQAVDLACWITGLPPREISASRTSLRWEDDHVLVHLLFADGLQARCNIAYADRGVERVRVIGRGGELWVSNPNMALHYRRCGQTTFPGSTAALDLMVLGYRGLRRSRSMLRYSVTGALKTFLTSLRDGQPFSPGFVEAEANARLLDAAADAMECGSTLTGYSA